MATHETAIGANGGGQTAVMATTASVPLRDAEETTYRWVILTAAFMMMLASAGISQAFSLFVKPMALDFGGARGNVSSAYAIYMICFGAGSFVMAWLADRMRMRLLLLIAAVSYSTGAVLSSLSNSLWSLNLAFGVLNGGAVGSLVGCLTYAVAQWFSVKKGLALGILLAGMGMGVFVSSMTAGAVMDLYGWRGAFLVLGLGALLVNIPAALLIRQRTDPRAIPQRRTASVVPGAGWSTASALKTWSFWSLNTTFVCCCLSHSIPLLHYIPYASDLGLTAQRGALLVTIGGLSNVVGRTGMGALSDWIGGKPALLICLVMQTLMVAWVMTYTSWPAWIVFAILFGIGSGGVFPLYPAITRSYFGAEGTGGIFGLQLLLSTVFGMALGPLVGGYLFDLFKTYQGAFLVSIVVGGCSIILLLTVRPPRRKPLPEAERSTTL